MVSEIDTWVAEVALDGSLAHQASSTGSERSLASMVRSLVCQACSLVSRSLVSEARSLVSQVSVASRDDTQFFRVQQAFHSCILRTSVLASRPMMQLVFEHMDWIASISMDHLDDIESPEVSRTLVRL